MKYTGSIFLLLILFACGKTEVKEVVEYKGPLREIENMELIYSQTNQVKVKMTAPLVYQFLTDDKEFPKGIYLEFYNELGALESTLRANHAYYFAKENKWRGRGDVVVRNILKKEQLNSEELFWTPTNKKIFTDKFVTIRKQGDIIYGQGMEAKQDLSDYVINNITGQFEVKESNEIN